LTLLASFLYRREHSIRYLELRSKIRTVVLSDPLQQDRQRR
jgi:hypothetical protein